VYAAQAYKFPDMTEMPEMTDWGEEMPRGDAMNGMGPLTRVLGAERRVARQLSLLNWHAEDVRVRTRAQSPAGVFLRGAAGLASE